MGEFFAELFGELLFKPILYGLCFATGKPIIYILSAGMLHAKLDAATENHGKRGKRKKSRFQHVALTYVENKKRYVNSELVVFVGIVFWGLVIAAIVLGVRRQGT